MNNASLGAARANGPSFALWSRVLTGFLLATLLIGGIGGWIMTAELNGAIISPGMVVIDQNMKSVQHRDGGIVSEILVREGDYVQAGEVILRLEDTQTRAELSIVSGQIVELTARRARLLAERAGLDEIAFPAGFIEASAAAAEIADGESRLFHGQQFNRKSQVQQLELGAVQIGEEIAGLSGQHDAITDEITLVADEYARTKGLFDRGLVEIGRLTAIERELIRLRGRLGEIDSSAARANTRISEIRLQILALDETSRTDAQRELGMVGTSLAELRERQNSLEDLLSRTDVRAPIDGVVNELNIHTIGGVISPAEVLVTLVPRDAALKIEFRLRPVQIEQVAVGNQARARFSSFNQRTTPELFGEVTYISAATTQDSSTGESYFLGRIELPAEELGKLGDTGLIPGMPVEVYVQTEERTVASYLIRPLIDQFNRAFRER